jgi:hypothetical protein
VQLVVVRNTRVGTYDLEVAASAALGLVSRTRASLRSTLVLETSPRAASLLSLGLLPWYDVQYDAPSSEALGSIDTGRHTVLLTPPSAHTIHTVIPTGSTAWPLLRDKLDALHG